MQASELKRMREFEAENARLKTMYTDLSLEQRALKGVLEINGDRRRKAANGSLEK